MFLACARARARARVRASERIIFFFEVKYGHWAFIEATTAEEAGLVSRL